MNLTNKTVLVTGGTKGIGKATVEAFINAGANVIINYLSDSQSAEQLIQNSKSKGQKALAIKADLTNLTEVSSMMEQVRKEFGSLDILINNAGIFDLDDSPESISAFENIFNMNFLAQIKVTNEALKLMSKGKIIFLSSIHGMIGHGRPDAIAYSAMKAALDSYMKNLAKHLAPRILVNSVAPGKTITPMWGEMDEEIRNEHAKDHLIGRWIEPEEIAEGIIFLAKNDAICGEILTIDGGMSLQTLG